MYLCACPSCITAMSPKGISEAASVLGRVVSSVCVYVCTPCPLILTTSHVVGTAVITAFPRRKLRHRALKVLRKVMRGSWVAVRDVSIWSLTSELSHRPLNHCACYFWSSLKAHLLVRAAWSSKLQVAAPSSAFCFLRTRWGITWAGINSSLCEGSTFC